MEGGDLEDGADVTGKEPCSALKYFHAPKAAQHNQRVASTSNPPPAAGHPRGQQGREEQGKDTAKQPYSGSPAARWRLDEQLKQVSAALGPSSLPGPRLQPGCCGKGAGAELCFPAALLLVFL